MNKMGNKDLSINSYTDQILASQGEAGLSEYLSKPQTYQIITVAADWGVLKNGDALLGQFGHHALILLSGNRVCEWTPNKTDITKAQITQIEDRMVSTGKELEEIWQTHLKLAPKYHRNGKMFDKNKEGYLHYLPFKNDCFSYVNRILSENNQRPTELTRTANSIVKFAKNLEQLSKPANNEAENDPRCYCE
jgi:hypothetical protein